MLVLYDSGRVAGLITLILSFLYFGTFGLLGFNFFQYVWYPLVVASVVAWRLNKPLVGGIALGIAAGLQTFPVMFVIPAVCFAIISWIRQRFGEFKISSVFVISFVLTIFIFFLLGSFSAGRIGIWQE